MPPPVSALETSIRGGTIALLLLLALIGWRDARTAAGARYGVLLDLCAAAYVIESAPALAHISPPWLLPIRVLSNVAAAAFQLWAAASFNDSFAPRWWRWLPLGGALVLAGCAVTFDTAALWRGVHVASLLLAGAGIAQILTGRGADLVERRRQLRLVLALGAGGWIAGLTLLSAAGSQTVRSAAGAVAAAGILALALAAALLRLRVVPLPGLVPAAVPAGVAADQLPRDASHPPDRDDRGWLDRLRRTMEHDRIYREEGLSVGTLASRLGLPEYRLRRLIHEGLGHRNFTSFVNAYRLEDVMAALADPSQAQVPILTIALDAGFQSIGPFNRAFKAQTGVTPTAFRRDRLRARDTAAAA